MGLQATVVHDSVRHAPLVVRSASCGASSTAALADTIASFSEHASLHRRETATEICARWGGPPFISYVVVKKRFRAMVVWDEEPGELDVAHDVHACMSTLQRAVTRHAAALATDDVDAEALAAVYTAAGRALMRGGDGAAAPDAAAALPDAKKRPSGLRALLGRTRRGADAANTQSARGKPRRADTQKARAPGELPPIDDAPSALALPPELFNWADFGGALPPSGGDIAWLADLLRGDEHRVAIAAPVLRDDKTPRLKMSSERSDLEVPALPAPVKEQTIPASAVAMSPSASDPVSPSASDPVSPPSLSAASPHAVPVAARQAPSIPIAARAPPQAVAPQLAPQPDSAPVRQPSDVPVVLAAPSPSSSFTNRPPQQQQPAVPVPSVPAMTAASPVQPALHTVPPVSAARAVNANVPVGAPRVAQPVSGIRGRGDAGDDFDLNVLGGYKDAATTTASIPTGNGGEVRTADPIRGMMNRFAKSMQAGQFEAALQQVSTTLRTLSSQKPPRMRETATCAHYVLSLKILIRVRALDMRTPAIAVQAAVLTMFMAELRHLLPTHRQAAMRMAIEKNMAIGNFGMAARWIRQIATTPDAKKLLSPKLQLCRQHGETNAHMPPTNKLCYNLLAILTPPYGKCANCPAVFRPGLSGVNIGQHCPVCFMGVIAVAQQ